jgi:hypothetical protein
MGHSDSQGFNYVYEMATNIQKALRGGLYLRGQIEDRFLSTGRVTFSGLNPPRDSLVFWGTYYLQRNLQLRGCPKMVLGGDKEAFSMVGRDLLLRRVESMVGFVFPVTGLPLQPQTKSS